MSSITSFGLEREYFVRDQRTGQFTLATTLPHDACGYLAEARSEPHTDPLVCRHLLNAAHERLDAQAVRAGLALVLAPTVELPNEFRRTCLRRFGKNPSKAYFMTGRTYTHSQPRAGLHVHFGSMQTFSYGRGEAAGTFTYSGQLNLPRIIWFMDRAFRDGIKAARRVPGEYELKDYGFEYRSLPADVSLDKVVRVLQALSADPDSSPDQFVARPAVAAQ